jgi:hypothetical protein
VIQDPFLTAFVWAALSLHNLMKLNTGIATKGGDHADASDVGRHAPTATAVYQGPHAPKQAILSVPVSRSAGARPLGTEDLAGAVTQVVPDRRAAPLAVAEWPDYSARGGRARRGLVTSG